jgi:hypothetical protein
VRSALDAWLPGIQRIPSAGLCELTSIRWYGQCVLGTTYFPCEFQIGDAVPWPAADLLTFDAPAAKEGSTGFISSWVQECSVDWRP